MSSQWRPPYVGVAAICTDEHLLGCLDEWAKVPDFSDSAALAVGLQMSNKTLFGVPNKHPLVFPTPARVAELGHLLNQQEASRGQFLAELHIHYFSDNRDQSMLDDELRRLVSLAKSAHRADGLQLNLTWPDPQLWQFWQWAFPDSRRIQPVTSEAMRLANGNPDKIVDMLGQYHDIITDVFFDLSGGLGVTLDVGQLLPHLQAVRQAYPKLRLGVAGGLGPDNLYLIQQLLNQGAWPLNWDAQSQLYYPDRKELDLGRTRPYLNQSGWFNKIIGEEIDKAAES